MIDWFVTLPFALQAFLATCFTWGITALGASLVIFFKKINKNVMDAMLGFAAGVMIAASFWSLLSPGIEMAENLASIEGLNISIIEKASQHFPGKITESVTYFRGTCEKCLRKILDKDIDQC